MLESWTLTCERADGTVVGTEQIVIDRGQRKTITACGAATRKTKGPKRPR